MTRIGNMRAIDAIYRAAGLKPRGLPADELADAVSAARYVLALDAGHHRARARCCSMRARPDRRRWRSASSPSTSRSLAGWNTTRAKSWQSQLRDHRPMPCAQRGRPPRDIAAVGITNQRETTVLWDRATGEPVAPAIVWQDRRTAPPATQLRAAGHEAEIRERTGLLLDPYFSGTKLAWLLDHVPGRAPRAERGELAFGTDRQLAAVQAQRGIARHVTDATNASRTLLFNLRTRRLGRPRCCELLRVPRALPAGDRRLLPRCARRRSRSSSTASNYPSTGIAGDQQSGTVRPGLLRRRAWPRTPTAPAASRS